MKAIRDEEFEEMFDAGEDIMDYVDVSSATRPNLGCEPLRIVLDLPAGTVRGIDRAAARMGVSREAVINVWLAERIDDEVGMLRKTAAMA